jgi:hypothetical protein
MSGLVVLEGKWSKHYNTSIKSLFDVLIDINFESPHEYYFDTFANSVAFRDILKHVCGPHSQNRRYLYIGAHGDQRNIQGSVKPITRARFRNSLHGLGGQMRGVFLGSCLFGTLSNAKFLFHPSGVPANVMWIAGYGKSVDWIESAVLDMLFWNTLFDVDTGNRTPREVIEETCRRVSEGAPGLVRRWDFQVFARPLGHATQLRRLIELGPKN